MKKVEEIFTKLAVEHCVKNVANDKKSVFVQRLFDAAKLLDKTGTMGNCSYDKFAKNNSNFNPGRCGLAEISQLHVLKHKYDNLERLSPSGEESVKFIQYTDDTIGIERIAGRSNITNIKSFDAIREDTSTIVLYMLKACDFGPFSDNKGGGSQDNVKAEIATLIETIKSTKNLKFEGKTVLFHIIIDGRTSSDIISEMTNKIGDDSRIVITDSENA